MTKDLTPAVKWAGGKSWLLPYIECKFEPFRKKTRFVEAFAGGMALALGLAPITATINDVNPHLINLYHWLKIGLPADRDIKTGEARTLVRMENCREVYLANRDRFNALIAADQWNTQEAALLFWYLNRTGFNGLCRFNKKGGYNVPFGKYASIDYAGIMEKFLQITPAIQGWRFLNRDFSKIPLNSSDFVFCDPPYDVPFTAYSKDGFTWYDQVRLAEWAGAHKGPVVCTNQATERIVDLYTKHGFEIHLLQAPRRIACNGNRVKVEEMVAIKNL